jgi:1,4-dihydroxy-2-naphthoate polyprenyltransferase
MYKWIEAARLRTLPLSLASIVMGSFLAIYQGAFTFSICLLTVLTTVFLQVLSNFANDYGDFQNGADLADRQGPARAVQSGSISPQKMLIAVVVMAVASLVSGIVLLFVAFKAFSNTHFQQFLLLGLAAIAAAYFYTAGKKPYGYAGLGDISVFLFFGILGVLGSYFLQAKTLNYSMLLPASASGLFAVAVLNINNLRDIASDSRAGKKTLPVRWGKGFGVGYHRILIASGLVFSIVYIGLQPIHFGKWLFLLCLPVFANIAIKINKYAEAKYIDTFLKKMALSALLFSILFGLGLIWAKI